MAKRYQLTARRRQALRKAQLASARKRKRNRNIKIAAVGAGVVGVAVARHKVSGSKINFRRSEHILSPVTKTPLGRGTGIRGFRHGDMRSVLGRKRGKTHDITLQYFHEPLNGKKIRSALGPAGAKIRSTRVGNQLAYKTRGIRGIRHPEIPYYKPYDASNRGYGANGKRLTKVGVMSRTIGGKAVKTKDVFGNLVRGSR